MNVYELFDFDAEQIDKIKLQASTTGELSEEIQLITKESSINVSFISEEDLVDDGIDMIDNGSEEWRLCVQLQPRYLDDFCSLTVFTEIDGSYIASKEYTTIIDQENFASRFI
jgi:hypothetical protein